MQFLTTMFKLKKATLSDNDDDVEANANREDSSDDELMDAVAMGELQSKWSDDDSD